jgi:DNA primase
VGCPFIDAIKELAAQAGMEVPPRSCGAKRAEKRAGLVDVTEAAQKWFAGICMGRTGRALANICAQEVSAERIVEEFGFGYAPETAKSP